MRKMAMWSIVGSAAMLAVMGLVFCWMCPAGREIGVGGPHWMFGRMVVGNLVGLALGGLALAFGWRRWLRFAPLVVAVWVGFVLYAASLPPIKGSIGWVRLGPVVFCVWEALPLIFGLMAAWASWKFRLHAFVTGLVIGLALSVFLCEKIVTNENRMNRVRIFLGIEGGAPAMDAHLQARQYLQERSAEVICGAKWFGATTLEPHSLPCAATAAMPAAASALYGKWSLALLCGLIVLMGTGFVFAWQGVAEQEVRALVLILGIMVVAPMAVGILGCLHYLPLSMCGIPWASFGGSLAALHWLALGVVASALKA